MNWLTDPFDYDFFGRALLAGILVGVLAGGLGVFVIERRMAYVGHGLSQAVLGGVGVAVVAGAGLYAGAAVAAMVAVLAILGISRLRGVHNDAAIGIVATTMFALGVAVISANRDEAPNLSNLLFGNVLGVSDGDVALVAIVTGALALAGVLSFKRVVAVTIDPTAAAAHGVRARVVELLFQIAVAAAVVAAVRVVGVTLIAASLIIPAATARLVCRSFGPLVLTGSGIGAVTAAAGLYWSYHADIASGPAVVLSAAVVFAVAAVLTSVVTTR